MAEKVLEGGSAPAATLFADCGLLTPQHLERFLYGLVLVEGDGQVLYLNRKARLLLMPGPAGDTDAGWRCCDLICGRLAPLLEGGCVSARAAATPHHLPEVRMDIDHDRSPGAAWVSAGWWGSTNERLLFHLRPGKPGDRRRRATPEWVGQAREDRPELQISVLRPFAVEGIDGPIGGSWVDKRPGQLLKFLVSRRGRAVSADQIAEAMWPGAHPEVARNRLRFYVHALREKLEPDRGHRSPARFLIGRGGGYELDTSHIWIDADEFEREAEAGLAALRQGLDVEAEPHLLRAMALYQAPFIAEEPYVDWALEERERLQGLATTALRARVETAAAHGQIGTLAADSRRLAEMEPFDADVQRLVIEVCLRRGRRGEALRRYRALRKRMLASFGEEPDFELGELFSDPHSAGVRSGASTSVADRDSALTRSNRIL